MPQLLALLVVILLMGLSIWALVDAATRPDSLWSTIDQTKLVWVVIILLVPVFGALLYLMAIRPKFPR